MNVIRAWLTAVATFFEKDEMLFQRFMLLLICGIGYLATPPRRETIVSPDYAYAFWVLSGIVISVIPDAFVVAINHPNSRRSQLVLCSVVIVIAVCVMYVWCFGDSSQWRNAAELI